MCVKFYDRIAKEKADKETEEQKLDGLSRQIDEIRLDFRQLIKAIKANGPNIQADSLASLDSGDRSKTNTLTKSTAKVLKESHTYENFGQRVRQAAKKPFHGGHFDSLHGRLDFGPEEESADRFKMDGFQMTRLLDENVDGFRIEQKLFGLWNKGDLFAWKSVEGKAVSGLVFGRLDLLLSQLRLGNEL